MKKIINMYNILIIQKYINNLNNIYVFIILNIVSRIIFY